VSIDALRRLLDENPPCVVLTGAGISTESGIPDFRGATGIWATYDPLVVASVDGFRRDPERVWEFYARRLGVLDAARPNVGHLALAELERRGLVRAVVTQNVDRLHQDAGSRTVVEVHGSIRTATCASCGTRLSEDELRAALPLPRCPRCGAIPKPDVVMFGEELDPAVLARATELAREAGLLLVVGSSLEVWPVAGLPLETLAAGGRLAIVNRDSTRFDERADLALHGSAGETLAGLT
jgi:NAD-dependent deacetylase